MQYAHAHAVQQQQQLTPVHYAQHISPCGGFSPHGYASAPSAHSSLPSMPSHGQWAPTYGYAQQPWQHQPSPVHMHGYTPFNDVSAMQPYRHSQPPVQGGAAFTSHDMHAKTYPHEQSEDAVRSDPRAMQHYDFYAQQQQHFNTQVQPQVSALSPAAAAFMPGYGTWSPHHGGAPLSPVPMGTLPRDDVSPTSHAHKCMHASASASQHVPLTLPPGLAPAPAATAPTVPTALGQEPPTVPTVPAMPTHDEGNEGDESDACDACDIDEDDPFGAYGSSVPPAAPPPPPATGPDAEAQVFIDALSKSTAASTREVLVETLKALGINSPVKGNSLLVGRRLPQFHRKGLSVRSERHPRRSGV